MEPTTSKKITKRQPKSKQPVLEETQIEPVFCANHQGKKVKFICSVKNCLQELCSFCILDHKNHIESISPISQKVQQINELILSSDPERLIQILN